MTIHEQDAPHLAGAVLSVGVLAYITYGLRVYTRLTRHSWGLEDWIMMSAVVSNSLSMHLMSAGATLTWMTTAAVHGACDRMHPLSIPWHWHPRRHAPTAGKPEVLQGGVVCTY
jgi:hypothetical protein